MASLLETLEKDLADEQGKLSAVQDQIALLEADADEAKSYDGIREKIAPLEEAKAPHVQRISVLNADIGREKARRERVRSAPSVRTPEDRAELDPAEMTRFGRSRSASDQFVNSEEWKAYKGQVAPNGHFSDNMRVESPSVNVGSLLPPKKGLVTGASATSGGAFIVADDTGIYDVGTFERELTVLDVISRGTTDSDVVEYVRQTGFTNLAAVVPEADNVLATDDTGRKPWSSMTFERIVETVATIAHGEAATTRALADAGQLRAIIDNWLRYGLLEELEDQIVNGDNSGDNFDGITHVTGTQDQAFVTNIATTIRKAKTKVRVVGKARANAVLLNPYDWEALDLFLTFNGPGTNYRQASQESEPRIWGLRIVETEAVAEGEAIVGDFRKAMLWDRQQTTIRATQGYMDFFMKNLVAILAELRAAFGVIRPAAFVIADTGTGS